MHVGLSFGTNREDRLAHLRDAKSRVLKTPGVEFVAASAVYETEPVDVQPQYQDLPFLNSVMIIAVSIDLDLMSDALHEIETAMGRVRTDDRNAPRPIDIDIIYADNTTMNTPALTLPHERWSSRRFVVQPLADVRPDLCIPDSHLTVRQILDAMPTVPTVRALTVDW
ncbi:MAG: 2-amino-4-hydroxy-6-hydroxymethyldihydropteridine diphosphokinase [Kiritimatiellae bacterium]|nr:2-amino-4-hydroxy-6-hydroxymethyldihydropteridine diphosphokinase [Kiritimatiellia bacterium]